MNVIRIHALLVSAPMLWPARVYDWTWPTPAECSPAEPCAEGEYCQYADRSCGNAGQKGTCQQKRECLGAEGRPVCGCNTEPYPNECLAAQAGVDFGHTELCGDKATDLACGYEYCFSGSEFCRHDPNGVACVKIPGGCEELDCSCSGLCEGGEPECHPDTNRGLTVICP